MSAHQGLVCCRAQALAHQELELHPEWGLVRLALVLRPVSVPPALVPPALARLQAWVPPEWVQRQVQALVARVLGVGESIAMVPKAQAQAPTEAARLTEAAHASRCCAG
jgi:hypothetical protein